ncbi:hypothetical protein [Rhodococcus rhodochrous]|uniref:Uncharacterized protein n=1 Tax=Rhodococcus rhodochrous TaxID=1829 RepID=A0AA46X4Z3_RHORH|nr:hypothetical protein [Rhodococcus rhodochrous]UZF48477.1 hypothetical protein KUM34_029320 [Rhodococcus rhodochrous]
MCYENVDKDPDLRKSSDLGPVNGSRSWWVLAAAGFAIGIVLAVGGGLFGFKLFGWITGSSYNDDQTASAGAWASAVGATALALASVWLAVQANGQARDAERRAAEEAALTAQRHQEEMEAAAERHARELAQADERLNRQIKAERYREQAQVIRDLWATVNAAILPTLTLAQVIDEHRALHHNISSDRLVIAPSVSKVSKAYTNWKLHFFEVQAAIEVVEMLVEDETIRSYLSSLSHRVQRHMEDAEGYKESAISHGGGAGVSMFPATISEFIALRKPMMSEIRRLLTAEGAQQMS